jgi:uncharacterized membrane protein (DUF485 family)
MQDLSDPPAQPGGVPDWETLEKAPEFRTLVREKRAFLLPATIFFCLYYFALPVLVGYFPEVMGREVGGGVNFAYLFALSQFVMAWAVMWLYVRRARGFDDLAGRVRERAEGGRR